MSAARITDRREVVTEVKSQRLKAPARLVAKLYSAQVESLERGDIQGST
jgi:hypothetical protein